MLFPVASVCLALLQVANRFCLLWEADLVSESSLQFDFVWRGHSVFIAYSDREKPRENIQFQGHPKVISSCFNFG